MPQAKPTIVPFIKDAHAFAIGADPEPPKGVRCNGANRVFRQRVRVQWIRDMTLSDLTLSINHRYAPRIRANPQPISLIAIQRPNAARPDTIGIIQLVLKPNHRTVGLKRY